MSDTTFAAAVNLYTRPSSQRKTVRTFLLIALWSLTALVATAEEPLRELPYTPGLDVSAMDVSVDPCVDFYQYSCGGWMERNPIPSDQERWSVFRKLAFENQRFLWGILDRLARETSGRNPTQRLIGDYFAACMDEAMVEKRGVQPLHPHLQRIEAMRAKDDVPGLLGELHLSIPLRTDLESRSGLFFGFGSVQDFADATRVIAFAGAGGIGLPDRDYYTEDDERARDIRAKYVAHIGRIFELLGDTTSMAQRKAAKVMEMETALARVSLTRVERRNPYNLFHKMNAATLRGLTPDFGWPIYLKSMGVAKLDTFNVTEPVFYKELSKELRSRPLADIKSYLVWHVVHALAPYLSSAFVNEDFAFFSRTLRGVPELKPRWKRCVALVDTQLGEALGQEFVSRTFGPELKERTLRMTRQIQQAMDDDIKALTWMGPATKEQALAKLHAIVNKIGYPDRWRDYSSVVIKRHDFIGNVERARRFEARRRLAKIGKPLDRSEWLMTPPTVSAYYHWQMNDINFPAGVLQPPLFDPKMDDAPNYGNTGGTIGHELTHGFDDQGRQFDALGNLKDWWTKEDAQAFKDRAQCIVDQYAQYIIIDDVKINSKLTLGEDVADLGGLILAWMAWKAEIANTPQQARDGLTPEQRFFVGNAQWACENDRPQNARVRALTDPHSPAKYRVNGLVVNMPEFQDAFACKAGQPMVRNNRCRVW